MELDESKLLDVIYLSNPAVKKSVVFDLREKVNPGGTLVVSITGVDNANQGLPDFWVSVSVQGVTFVNEDKDKAIIRTMFSDAMQSVMRWTPQQLTQAFGMDAPAAVVGIIDISSTIASNATIHSFNITCRLATTDLYLEYYEHPLPVFDVDDTGSGVVFLRFVNSDPCAVQRFTTVIEVDQDGVQHKTETHEVAYGNWADRASLTYYPINQSIPVQIEQ